MQISHERDESSSRRCEVSASEVSKRDKAASSTTHKAPPTGSNGRAETARTTPVRQKKASAATRLPQKRGAVFHSLSAVSHDSVEELENGDTEFFSSLKSSVDRYSMPSYSAPNSLNRPPRPAAGTTSGSTTSKGKRKSWKPSFMKSKKGDASSVASSSAISLTRGKARSSRRPPRLLEARSVGSLP